MPRFVRNFWIELEIDGRRSRVACGPRRADGGFRARIFIRREGRVAAGMAVEGRRSGGKCELVAWALNGGQRVWTDSGECLIIETDAD